MKLLKMRKIALLIISVVAAVSPVESSSSFTCESKDLYDGVMGPPGRPGKSGAPGPKGEPGLSSGLDANAALRIKSLEASLQNVNAELSQQKETIRRLETELEAVRESQKSVGSHPVSSKSPVIGSQSGSKKAEYCSDVPKRPSGKGGVYKIYPPAIPSGITVYCDTETDGGGWIVFQKRYDGSESFERTWKEYVDGFGDTAKEHWLGLENVYKITSIGNWQLRVDLEDWNGVRKYAIYQEFTIGPESTGYEIKVDKYLGTAGNALSYHNGFEFATFDKDTNNKCARTHRGGWWFFKCAHANLNGVYSHGGTYTDILPIAVIWKQWHGFRYSLKSTQMKIKRI